MVSNFLQRPLSCLAHSVWRQRKEVLISIAPPPTHVPTGPMFAWAERVDESCNLMQSSKRQWNWSYQHKYAALLPKYKPSWAVTQNWLTGVGQKQEKLYLFRPSQCRFLAELWGRNWKYFISVFPRSSPRVARFYHYKFGLNGTCSVSCISFLKVMLGGSLEHLHFL